jgi:hypothetical protein
MMVPDDRRHGIGKVDHGEDVGADGRVLLHDLKFRRAQAAGFVQDVLGNGDLADIVQQ